MSLTVSARARNIDGPEARILMTVTITARLRDFDDPDGTVALFVDGASVLEILSLLGAALRHGSQPDTQGILKELEGILTDPLGRPMTTPENATLIRCGVLDGAAMAYMRCSCLRDWVSGFRRSFDSGSGPDALIVMVQSYGLMLTAQITKALSSYRASS